MRSKTSHTAGLDLSYKFHAVGQGLFATGGLHIDLVPRNGHHRWHGEFRWVYDCGSASGGKLLRRRIREYLEEIKTDLIPLVFVSHFDEDHMNGLAELLSETRIHQLVLPWIPLHQRIEIAILEEVPPASDAFLFFTSPVEYIGSRFPGRVTEIIFVPPGREGDVVEPLVDDPPPDPEGLRNMEQLPFPKLKVEGRSAPEGGEDDKAQALHRGIEISWLREAGRLYLQGVYEFVPYNDQRFQPPCPEDFVQEVMKATKPLMDFKNLTGRFHIFLHLKNLYHNTFRGKSRNGISLFVYGGLLRPDAFAQNTWTHLFGNRDKSGHLHAETYPKRPGWLPFFNTSILYTGDGYLEDSSRMDALERFLHRGRLERVGILQVMHHGSRNNCYKGIAQRLRAKVSVFSSDPHGRFKHPHHEVFQEFMWSGPVQVTKTSDYEFASELAYTDYPKALNRSRFMMGRVPTRLKRTSRDRQ